MIVIEAAPHIPGEPLQRLPGTVDQRHHALARPGTAGALALADVQLPEPPRVPPDVIQVEVAGLADAQADLAHQPERRVVTGGAGALPAAPPPPPPPPATRPPLHPLTT